MAFAFSRTETRYELLMLTSHTSGGQSIARLAVLCSISARDFKGITTYGVYRVYENCNLIAHVPADHLAAVVFSHSQNHRRSSAPHRTVVMIVFVGSISTAINCERAQRDGMPEPWAEHVRFVRFEREAYAI